MRRGWILLHIEPGCMKRLSPPLPRFIALSVEVERRLITLREHELLHIKLVVV